MLSGDFWLLRQTLLQKMQLLRGWVFNFSLCYRNGFFTGINPDFDNN